MYRSPFYGKSNNSRKWTVNLQNTTSNTPLNLPFQPSQTMHDWFLRRFFFARGMSFFARGQPPYLGCVGQALKAGINLLICQSMCLAVYPSIYNLSVYLSSHLSIQLYFYRNMFIYQSIFIPILFIYLSNNLNIHLHFFNQGWTNFGEDNQDLKCIFAVCINNESSYWPNHIHTSQI